MSSKRILKRVKIDDLWYDASEGWAGTFNLRWGSGSDIRKFTAKEPYVHMSDFYHVYDENGSQVGEIDINNKSCSGRVSSFEIDEIRSSSSNSSSNSSPSDYSRNSPQYEDNAGYGRSLDDDPHAPLRQAVQGSSMGEFLSGFAPLSEEQKRKIERSNKEYYEEQAQWRREESEREASVEKEAWKKKRLFFYGLGGIIGVIVFAVLPSLGGEFAVMVSAVILAVVIGILTKNWLLGLISGIVGGIISSVIGIFPDYLPLPVLLPILVPIGFGLGALIVKILKEIV
jgi:hypothetical protein